ncbi:DUF4355 domain-containing protein [Enterococcus sp. 5H]|uniref:DUF4355 domain-containing protein n=1 Tax=Enterococcus sp. 5H TaxID=1229490 RepID=UPI002303A0FC|nr:DUF4355 domain-containing protein [Enterococcus sp. 5H]MDA9470579.1 putative scaffold protein [Enterococcus sp. 5H]
MKKRLLKLDLQFFTEGEQTDEQTEVTTPKPGDPDFDAAVSKAVEKALENNNKKWQTKLDEQIVSAKEEAKTEVEKMAQMNAEQKIEYERQQRDEELNQRERTILARELKAQATTQLSEANLPLELVDLINVSDGGTAQKSFDALKVAWEKAQGSWEKAIEEKVNEKLVASVDTPLNVATNQEINPWNKNTLNLTKQGEILREDPEKAKMLMAQANK